MTTRLFELPHTPSSADDRKDIVQVSTQAILPMMPRTLWLQSLGKSSSFKSYHEDFKSPASMANRLTSTPRHMTKQFVPKSVISFTPSTGSLTYIIDQL